MDESNEPWWKDKRRAGAGEQATNEPPRSPAQQRGSSQSERHPSHGDAATGARPSAIQTPLHKGKFPAGTFSGNTPSRGGSPDKRPKIGSMEETAFAQLQADLKGLRDGRVQRNLQEYTQWLGETEAESSKFADELALLKKNAEESHALSAASIAKARKTRDEADALLQKFRSRNLSKQGTTGLGQPGLGGTRDQPMLMDSFHRSSALPLLGFSDDQPPPDSDFRIIGEQTVSKEAPPPPPPPPSNGDCGIAGLVVVFVLDEEDERRLPVVNLPNKNNPLPSAIKTGKIRAFGTLPMGFVEESDTSVYMCAPKPSWDVPGLHPMTLALLTRHNNNMFLHAKSQSAYRNMVNRGMREVQHKVVSCIQCQIIGRNRNECSLEAGSREACHCLKRNIPCSRMLRLSEQPEVFGMVFFPVPEIYRPEALGTESGYWVRENDEVALPAAPKKRQMTQLGSSVDTSRQSSRSRRGSLEG